MRGKGSTDSRDNRSGVGAAADLCGSSVAIAHEVARPAGTIWQDGFAMVILGRILCGGHGMNVIL